MLQFSRIFSSVILVLILIILGTTIYSLYASIANVPSLFVLQIDHYGEDDRIILTNNKLEYESTVFEHPEIITFAVNKNEMLVLTNQAEQSPSLEKINLKNKNQSEINVENKYIKALHGSETNFIIEYEDLIDNQRDYITLLGTFDTKKDEIEPLNPDFIAEGVSHVKLNLSGTQVVFDGVAGKQYRIELNNPESPEIIDKTDGTRQGFINNQVEGYYYIERKQNDTYITRNVENGQRNEIDLGIKSTKQVESDSTLSNIFVLQSEVKSQDGGFIESPLNEKSTMYYVPGQVYSQINLSPDQDFLLTKSTGRDPFFKIYKTSTDTFYSKQMFGDRALWEYK